MVKRDKTTQIKWREIAFRRYHEIILYLGEKWPPYVVEKFVERTWSSIATMEANPNRYRRSACARFREVILHGRCLLLYKELGDHTLELVTFFDTRMDPVKKNDSWDN